jgi:bidirectional [NiFe] hydrogenase diaphorase subunit
LTKIYNGEGTLKDLALLESLCEMVRETSLCGLGQTAPNPVVSTLRYFRHEYMEKLLDANGAGQPEKVEEVPA